MPYQILVIDDNREHLRGNIQAAERAVAEADKTDAIEVKGVDSVPAMRRAIAVHSERTVEIIAASTDNTMYKNPKAVENIRALQNVGIQRVAVVTDDAVGADDEIVRELIVARLSGVPVIPKGDSGALQKFFADAIRKALGTS